MKALFTIRHKDALDAKTLKPSFAGPLRAGIERLLASQSEWGGWNGGENFTYDRAEDLLRTVHGKPLLAYRDDQRVEVGFRDLLLYGWPGHVLDALEAWLEGADYEAAQRVESDLNDLLTMHRSEWRFVNGLAMKIDSDYLHEEVVAKTARLLDDARFAGPQEEFQKAIAALQSGDGKQAVTEAHKSVESTMKAVLGSAGHVTFGSLLAQLLKSGLVPDYYEEFLQHFEKLALGAVKERNRPGRGHGQGATPQTVSPALARLALHLAGSINVFLVERWIEAQGKPTPEPQPVGAGDDDIPF